MKVYRIIGLLVLATVILMAISYLFIGTIVDFVLSILVLFMLLFIPGLLLYNYHRPIFLDYVFSSWDMNLNTVARSNDLSIRKRGIHVAIDYNRGAVFFPLPPLNIAVARGRKLTYVYVGPVSVGTPDSIEGLKSFVDLAMGERR